MVKLKVPRCRHCKKRPGTRRRGLCHPCYADKGVRSLYKPISQGRRGVGLGKYRGPAPRPTFWGPCSEGKIDVLCWRARNNYDLFREGDNKIPNEQDIEGRVEVREWKVPTAKMWSGRSKGMDHRDRREGFEYA